MTPDYLKIIPKSLFSDRPLHEQSNYCRMCDCGHTAIYLSLSVSLESTCDDLKFGGKETDKNIFMYATKIFFYFSNKVYV